MHKSTTALYMFGALVRREFRAALLNRFIVLFCTLSLGAGLVPLLIEQTRSADATLLFLIQCVPYLVPVFALLIGCGVAQADLEERDFLLSSPIPRGMILLGKLSALWILFAIAALFLVIPAGFGECGLRELSILWLYMTGTGGVFLALGLAIGFSTADRVKALLVALSVWFLFLAGFDLVALGAASVPAVQGCPGLWTLLLALNPLDALRVGQLLTAAGIPFDASRMPFLVQWWVGHLGVCFTAVSAGWISLGLGWSRWRMEKG